MYTITPLTCTGVHYNPTHLEVHLGPDVLAGGGVGVAGGRGGLDASVPTPMIILQLINLKVFSLKINLFVQTIYILGIFQ